jgi:hypothetical protein
MGKGELEILLEHGREIARLRSDADMIARRLRSLELRLGKIERLLELMGGER